MLEFWKVFVYWWVFETELKLESEFLLVLQL